MSQFKIFTIEGNIGSGKSTLLEFLRNEMIVGNQKIIFMKEPVDEWEDIKDSNGKTMLQKFYENQEKYSFPFQMMAYISRLKLLKEMVEKYPDAVIISERSLYTDKYVFAKMLYETNKIEDVNYQIYCKWFDTFVKDYPITGTIYVKTDPEICHDRIAKRSRVGESNIPLDYLVSCHKYHNDMLDIEKRLVSKNQLVMDGNVDIFYSKDILNDWIKNIKKFIKNISHIEIDDDVKSPNEEHILYFDGCSKGNPGLGGAGAVLYKDDQEIWGSSQMLGKNVTNNVAEYSGLIMGLKEVYTRKIKNIIVRGDSQLVIKQMRGEYKVNSQSLEEYYKQAKFLEGYFDKIVFEHVYRDKNKRADELSNMAIEYLLP